MKPGRLILSLIMGIALIAFGIVLASKTTATCNGHQMSQSDQCVTISHHGLSRVTRSRDQQLSKDHNVGYTLVGVGVLFMLLSVFLVFTGRRRPTTAGPGYGPVPLGPQYPAGQPYAQQGQQYPAGQPYAQQGAPYPPHQPYQQGWQYPPNR